MFKAGFARLDITPPLGSEIAGETYPRFARGVLDPLYINAVAVSDGDKTAVMMTLDFLGIHLAYHKKICDKITEKTGIPTEYLYVAALHQHTACVFSDKDKSGFNALGDERYKSYLIDKFADAAVLAIADLTEARVTVGGKETARPLAYVRRYVVENGDIVTNPLLTLKPQRRCAEADNTVRLVRFIREGAPDIALVNFSTHPDVVGADFYPTPDVKLSADWPGFVRRFVEEDIKDTHCIFFTGAQGDSNHIDFLDPVTRGLHGTGYEHARYMGRTIADVVVDIWDKGEEKAETPVFSARRTVFSRTNTEGIEDYEKHAAWYADYRAGKFAEEPYFGDIAYSRRIAGLRTAPIFSRIPMAYLSFCGVVMAGFGGEAFTEYGNAARALLPDKFVVSTVCTNGYQGYFPTAKAFTEGGYEVMSSSFLPTLEGEIISALGEMAKEEKETV